MNNLGFNQHVFILNGEPLILQRNPNVNTSVGSIINSGSITLQSNSIHESDSCNVNEQNISSKQQLEGINSENLISIQDTNNGDKNGNDSEYVTYVGDSDEDEASTIHLTLEQAAELGLHFHAASDESKLSNNFPVATSRNQITEVNNKRVSSFSLFNKNSMITNNVNNHELELSVFNDRKLINDGSNCKNIEENATKENASLENGYKTPADETALENINVEDSNITLIPHFINGTITYSVQINNNSSNEPIKKSLKPNNGNKNFLNAASKDILQNSVTSSLNDNDFNNTIKPFTTCSDLTSFVESNLDSTSNSEPISTSAQLIDTTTQNVMSTNSNVTILPSSIISDSSTKLSTNNFTSLTDIIKCIENSNNLHDKTNNFNLLGLTNYQHISLSHLLNNSNKIQQNDKSFQSCTPVIANIITNSTSTSDNVISSADSNVLRDMKNNVTLLKNTVCSDNAVLLSTGTNKTNFTIANNANANSILIPISIGAKSTMTPSATVMSAVDNDNQQKQISTINDDDLSNLIHIRSTTSAASLVSNNTMNVDSVQSNTVSNNSNINVRLSNLNTVASSNLKMNKTVVNRSSTLPSGTLNELNQNCLNITSTPVPESLLNGNNERNNQQTVTQQLSLISSLTAVTTSTITSTTTVTSTTTACSTDTGNLTPATTNANSVAMNTSLPVTPTVKSVKTAKSCVLPKEVSAALSKLPLLNNSNKPLGSSENPIQLVQQGHTFHSAQALTDEQLKQITTVLQQNNLSTNVPAKNVLYDAETNTKIIYRVVYPEEFDLKEASTSGDEINGKGRKRGRPHKSHAKDSAGNAHDENSTTKRKQPLPRTRSGRLSRPPRYMVRDYKRIKRSELDDSDGAYSDYQSDHEEENSPTDKNLLPGLLLPQKRNISSTFRCPTCNKIYLGYRRMAHHFDKYSDHGTEEYLIRLKKACENKQITYNPALNGNSDGVLHNNVNSETMIFNGAVNNNTSSNNPAQMVTPTTVMSASAMINRITSTVTPSENTSINVSATLSDHVTSNLPNSNNLVNRNVARIGIGIGFGKRRGRKKNGRVTGGGGLVRSIGTVGVIPPISQHPASPISGQMDPEQLKTRLKELLELCDVSELVQIAGPAVCRVLSTWELLMLRIDSLGSKQNRISALCDEIKDLSNRFKELANSLFQPVDSIIKNSANSNNYGNNSSGTFQMDDKIVSDFFGVPCGVYKIDESLLGTDKIVKGGSLPTSLISNTNSDETLNNMVTLDKETVSVSSDSLTLPSIKSLEESTRCNINRGLDCGDADSNTNLNNEQLDNGGVSRNVNVPSLTSGQFLLTNESGILCDDRGTSLDDSVDQIVNEQLKNLTSSPQNHHHHQEDLCKVEVDELMKNFSVLDHHHHRSHHHLSHESHHQSNMVRMRSHTDPLDPSEDDLMDGFTSITNQRTHVSASTEDLIKSLENFGSELHNSTCDDDASRQGFINTNDSFNDRVVGVNVVNNVVDTLDFDVLSQDFHHSTNVNQQ